MNADFFFGIIVGFGTAVLFFVAFNAVVADRVDSAEDKIRQQAGKARGLFARLKAFFGK